VTESTTAVRLFTELAVCVRDNLSPLPQEHRSTYARVSHRSDSYSHLPCGPLILTDLEIRKRLRARLLCCRSHRTDGSIWIESLAAFPAGVNQPIPTDRRRGQLKHTPLRLRDPAGPFLRSAAPVSAAVLYPRDFTHPELTIIL